MTFARRAEVAEPLVKAGANIEAKDNLLQTPLERAIREGSMAYVKLLMEAGADINAKDYYGKSMLKIAREMGYRDRIAALLADHGARE